MLMLTDFKHVMLEIFREFLKILNRSYRNLLNISLIVSRVLIIGNESCIKTIDVIIAIRLQIFNFAQDLVYC